MVFSNRIILRRRGVLKRGWKYLKWYYTKFGTLVISIMFMMVTFRNGMMLMPNDSINLLSIPPKNDTQSQVSLVTIDTIPACSCVNCEEDQVCGGLWKANRYTKDPKANQDDALKKKEIHIVISHCKSDLHWVANFTKGHEESIASIHIVTKCGAPVHGAPEKAVIQKLPNVGRCDHSYAYYITTLLDRKMTEHGGKEKDSIVMFLKDDMSQDNLHQGARWNSFASMVRIAASSNGFACGVDLSEDTEPSYSYSAYHNPSGMFQVAFKSYTRNQKDYVSDGIDFASGKYENLGVFYKHLDAGPLPELVQVCYGGVFAASVENIKKTDISIWKKAEESLSRGDNIQEGHYMERLWGPLLSTPLETYQIQALKEYSHDIDNIYVGALYRNNCFCVDCEDDEVCGGLWKADSYPPRIEGVTDPHDTNIHIVISHCKSDLDWVANYTHGYEDSIVSIHVITKCGAPVRGAPENAVIQELPNVGRCDHTYAYYITTLLDQKMTEHGGNEENSIVMFLKDDLSDENNSQGGHRLTIDSMVRIASSSNGFACGTAPWDTSYMSSDSDDKNLGQCSCSAYHLPFLLTFTVNEYERNIKGYDTDGVDFVSGKYDDLGSFHSYLDVGPLPGLVQVCYGGVFAASVKNIKNMDASVWKRAEESLSRGNNIQEGHYMERMWARLLSTPIEEYQVNAIKSFGDKVTEGFPFNGILCKT